jgi:cytoskeleton protein RodZ
MDSVGTLLRSERERQHRTVTEIATALCITPAYLHAIEHDDLKSLPGTFFYKSFAKQYAAVLGVPEKRIQPSLEELTAPEAEPPLPGQDPHYSAVQTAFQNHWFAELKQILHRDQSCPDASAQSGIRALDPIVEAGNSYFTGQRLGASVVGLVAVLLVCSGFYAWWNHVPQAAAAQSVVASEPAPAARGVATNVVNSGANNRAGKNAGNAAIDVTTTQSADGRAVLNLSATDEVWLSVTANGHEVFSGVLKPAQTKTLTGIEAAQMKVGNAGGLDVRWNGKPIGPIGPRGQVRTVVLTPDGSEVLPPTQLLDE